MESCVIVPVKKKEWIGEESCCSTIGWGRNEQGKDFAGDALFLFNKNWNWNSSKDLSLLFDASMIPIPTRASGTDKQTRHNTFCRFCTRTGCSLVYRMDPLEWNRGADSRAFIIVCIDWWKSRVSPCTCIPTIHEEERKKRKGKRRSSGAVNLNWFVEWMDGGKQLFCFALFVGCLVRQEKGCHVSSSSREYGPFIYSARSWTIDRWVEKKEKEKTAE